MSEEVFALSRRYDSLLFGAEHGNSGAVLLTERVAGGFDLFFGRKRKEVVEQISVEAIRKILSEEEKRIAGKNVGSAVLEGIEYLKELVFVKTELPKKEALLQKNIKIADE